jgi:hypothetical protein
MTYANARATATSPSIQRRNGSGRRGCSLAAQVAADKFFEAAGDSQRPVRRNCSAVMLSSASCMLSLWRPNTLSYNIDGGDPSGNVEGPHLGTTLETFAGTLDKRTDVIIALGFGIVLGTAGNFCSLLSS